ncbi:MAG: GNAT family N-acetyltransferase [Planctomycetes bacterium]|nr:GNAT family N-acetyltransferase [Planctomycetota bacterium]MCC7170732.1 GNAT family N-acetyltransferase [Planctomycetota bacterium]
MTRSNAVPVARTPALREVRGDYRLRFAANADDVRAAKRLRFEVFHDELHEGLAANAGSGLDADEFDAQCDHLLVERAADGRVIGTYRLQTQEIATNGRGFYSATEFDLSPMGEIILPAAVELGRACVAADHRNRNVLFLLWRGLAAYLLAHRKRYFFGCSSLTSQHPADGLALAVRFARDGVMWSQGVVLPRPEFACSATEAEIARARVGVPALFFTYLRHGAVLCGPPAIDRAFGTIDFLTLLDCARMPASRFEAFARDLPDRPTW